jgi:hypothetical protein
MPVHLNQHVQAVVFGMVEQKDTVRMVGQRDRDEKAPKCFGELSQFLYRSKQFEVVSFRSSQLLKAR